MNEFLIKEIINADIENELKDIGFDEGYRFIASDKFKYKNLKIYGLNSAQANIIKQAALSVGADCATHKSVIQGKIEKSNVILGGSISQLKKIAENLRRQPFKLYLLGNRIEEHINLKKRSVKTKLMGILNVTPDSFSDGGKYIEPVTAQKHLIELIQDGADIIDIGAESTKPYSEAVSADEQIERLKPIMNFILKENINIPISIDTRSSIVADFVLNNGASIINDVSGLDYDTNMAKIISKHNAGLIIQHSKGIPENMQDNPTYNNLIEEIFLSLKNKIEYAKNIGISDIIADVGIGFGKTKKHNFEILDRIEEFYALNCPIMAGISRKSMLGTKEDNNELKDSLTLAVSYPLIRKNIDYLRVHNVKLHKSLLNCLNF